MYSPSNNTSMDLSFERVTESLRNFRTRTIARIDEITAQMTKKASKPTKVGRSVQSSVVLEFWKTVTVGHEVGDNGAGGAGEGGTAGCFESSRSRTIPYAIDICDTEHNFEASLSQAKKVSSDML
jgi:hypothetical protein